MTVVRNYWEWIRSAQRIDNEKGQTPDLPTLKCNTLNKCCSSYQLPVLFKHDCKQLYCKHCSYTIISDHVVCVREAPNKPQR